MKQTMIFIGMLTVVVLLAACGQAAAPAASSSTSSGQTAPNGTLPESTQIILGTFKLEGTANAVDAAEAAKLIPLYKMLVSLETSTSSAPQEVSSVEDQIKSTMTAAQIKAIMDMKLTRQDMMTIMQDQGLTNNNASSGTNSGSSSSSRTTTNNGGGFPAGGDFAGGAPGGGVPGGGAPGGSSSTNLNPQQLATIQARRASGGMPGGGRFNTGLINALVKMLEAKTK